RRRREVDAARGGRPPARAAPGRVLPSEALPVYLVPLAGGVRPADPELSGGPPAGRLRLRGRRAGRRPGRAPRRRGACAGGGGAARRPGVGWALKVPGRPGNGPWSPAPPRFLSPQVRQPRPPASPRRPSWEPIRPFRP